MRQSQNCLSMNYGRSRNDFMSISDFISNRFRKSHYKKLEWKRKREEQVEWRQLAAIIKAPKANGIEKCWMERHWNVQNNTNWLLAIELEPPTANSTVHGFEKAMGKYINTFNSVSWLALIDTLSLYLIRINSVNV